MPIIQLKAHLQAYSRSPFYADTVREAPKDEISYVRKNGEWVGLDTTLLQDSLEDFKSQVASLESQVGNVDIYLDVINQKLIFINAKGIHKQVTLPTLRIDNITVGRNKNGQLYQINVPDDKTIKIVNERYEQDANDIDIYNKISGELRVDAIYATTDASYLSGQAISTRLKTIEKNILDLENTLQGTGGFLDPYNFYNDGIYNKIAIPLLNLDQDVRNTLLTNYAKDQLDNGVIADQTKIKDLYDSRVWIWVNSKGIWLDEGQDTVVTANNDGVLGSVTGVKYDPNDASTQFKIAIDIDDNGRSLGTMSVNGIREEFNKVVYKDTLGGDSEFVEGALVQRSANGTIKAANPIEDDDVITQGAFNDWLSSSIISKEDIDAIYKEVFEI